MKMPLHTIREWDSVVGEYVDMTIIPEEQFPIILPRGYANETPLWEWETCPHGLSAWLCVDPINHYPPDNWRG